MKLRELWYVSIADNITINFAPFILAEDNLSFLPVIHPYFIQAGSIIADEDELVPASLGKRNDHGHFKFMLIEASLSSMYPSFE